LTIPACNDGQASAGQAHRDEPFIHDQRVGGALVAAKGVVPGEALLIGGDAGDCPAAKKEAVADRMGAIMGYDLTAGLPDVVEGRLLRQHYYRPAGQQHAPLVRTIGVEIDERLCEARRQSRLGNRGDDPWETAAVIEMPVRQQDVSDCREVDLKSPRIFEPQVGIRADIEE
jgi:hypothetical protein